MVHLYTEIEINALPSKVREVLLNFPEMRQWHTGFTIEQLPSSTSSTSNNDTSSPPEIQKDTKLKVIASGTTFYPVVLENTPSKLSWIGSIPYLFTGIHEFHFLPGTSSTSSSSTSTPSSGIETTTTRLIQEENFTGLLSFLAGPTWFLGQGTRKQFEELNESLKRRCESL